MKRNKLLLSACILSTALSATAAKQYAPDGRSQLPAALAGTYIGFGGGYTDIPFSNSNLINGQTATSFKNPSFGLNIAIGHYFNRYLAAEISLMRPIKWSYAYGVSSPSSKNSIWTSLFGIALRPTLPLSPKWSAYGLIGLGIASRHGFNNNNGTVAIPSTDLMTLLTGGGMSYALTSHWNWNTGVEYSVAQPKNQEPSIFYGYTGFSYIFEKLHLPSFYKKKYIFQKNLVQFGAFDTGIFNPNVNKYFTVGYLPIFWTGDVTARKGVIGMYERNIFHTYKSFSFDVGTSISSYSSSVNNTSFEAFSVFPLFRFWFLRYPSVDMYFMYSIAGPTYLTRSTLDNTYLGGKFTFQDLMGIGMMMGKQKHVNLEVKIGHYSNGNLLPNNPGIQVPMVVSLGYAF